MGLSSKLITEEIYNKAKIILKESSEISRVSLRLRAIVAAKEHGVATVSKIFNITSNTLRSWVKSFVAEEVGGLNYRTGRGRKSKLLEVHREAIEEWISKDCNLTLAQIVIRLEEEFSIKSSKSAVHRVLDDLKLSYITSRPTHSKGNLEAQELFKKKSKEGN
ncbi:Transposase [Rickettsiales bacterium Ac37b]|nr:Transposase [Rickettsiales bacterium Ac37b]